jgi:hypothetical protein
MAIANTIGECYLNRPDACRRIFLAVCKNISGATVLPLCAVMDAMHPGWNHNMPSVGAPVKNHSIHEVQIANTPRDWQVSRDATGVTVDEIGDFGQSSLEQLNQCLIQRPPTNVRLAQGVHTQLATIGRVFTVLGEFFQQGGFSGTGNASLAAMCTALAKLFFAINTLPGEDVERGYRLYRLAPARPLAAGPGLPPPSAERPLLERITGHFRITPTDSCPIVVQIGGRVSMDDFKRDLPIIANGELQSKHVSSITESIWNGGWTYQTLQSYLMGLAAGRRQRQQNLREFGLPALPTARGPDVPPSANPPSITPSVPAVPAASVPPNPASAPKPAAPSVAPLQVRDLAGRILLSIRWRFNLGPNDLAPIGQSVTFGDKILDLTQPAVMEGFVEILCCILRTDCPAAIDVLLRKRSELTTGLSQGDWTVLRFLTFIFTCIRQGVNGQQSAN